MTALHTAIFTLSSKKRREGICDPRPCAIKYLTGQTPLLRNTTGNETLHLKYALSPLILPEQHGLYSLGVYGGDPSEYIGVWEVVRRCYSCPVAHLCVLCMWRWLVRWPGRENALPQTSPNVTVVRSLICVYTAVTRQMTGPRERLTADVTVVRSLICVYAAVTRQITEVGERLTTDVTAVGSLICVYAAVSRQSTELSERLTADVTSVRSLICMYTAVTRQVTGLSERFTTLITTLRWLFLEWLNDTSYHLHCLWSTRTTRT